MNKKYKCGILLILIIIILFIPMLWHIFKQNKSVLIDFEYSEEHIEGNNKPIVNIPIEVSINDIYSETLYTNSLGQIQVNIFDENDYSFNYTWQNIEYYIDIDDTQSSTINLVLDTWYLESIFKWSDNSIINKSIDLLLWNGADYVFLISVDIIDGYIVGGNLSGLFIGNYMFNNQNDTFIITQNSEYNSLPNEIYIELKCAYIS